MKVPDERIALEAKVRIPIDEVTKRCNSANQEIEPELLIDSVIDKSRDDG